MYKILLETEKNQFERSTKEELEEALLNLNGYFKEISKKENIRIYKTNQGNIKDEIVFSLPKEKDEISNCLEKFCLEKEEVNEEKEEAYKQEQETKLKEEVDNKELDESDKEVLKTLKNLRNQDSEDIQAEVVPSVKEKQRQIRQQIEKTNLSEKDEERPEPEKEVEEAKTEVIENEKEVELDEEVLQEKSEDKEFQTPQKQELVTNNEKENIVYVPKKAETAKSIMFRTFQTALREMRGERKKLEEIIKIYEEQIDEHKKAEKRLKENLETLNI